MGQPSGSGFEKLNQLLEGKEALLGPGQRVAVFFWKLWLFRLLGFHGGDSPKNSLRMSSSDGRFILHLLKPPSGGYGAYVDASGLSGSVFSARHFSRQ